MDLNVSSLAKFLESNKHLEMSKMTGQVLGNNFSGESPFGASSSAGAGNFPFLGHVERTI